MFAIKRTMVDEDGTTMSGYLTEFGQYGTRDKAYLYESYEEAEEDYQTESGYWNQECPQDDNAFDIVEF